MSRYIDADELVIDYYDDYETEDDVYTYAYVSKSQIDSAPSIDIEPKRGEWKRMKFTDCGSPVDKCSICGHYINGDVEVRNFCPNCGARMKGADDE